jgi:hypothetical protein
MPRSLWEERMGLNLIPHDPTIKSVELYDVNQNIYARIALSRFIAELIGGEGIYSPESLVISDFGDNGKQLPAMTIVINDSEEQPWFFKTDGFTDIEFQDENANNGELYAVPYTINSSLIGNVAVGAIDGVVFIAKNYTSEASFPIADSIKIGTGYIKDAAFVNFTAEDVFSAFGGLGSWILLGDNGESQEVIRSNNKIKITGGQGVSTTLENTREVNIDLDLAEYPGLEIVDDELKLKISYGLEFTEDNELILSESVADQSWTLEGNVGSKEINIGNFIQFVGENDISTIAGFDENGLIAEDHVTINLSNPINSMHTWTGINIFKENVIMENNFRLIDSDSDALEIDFSSAGTMLNIPEILYSQNIAISGPKNTFILSSNVELASDNFVWTPIEWEDTSETLDPELIWISTEQPHLITFTNISSGWYLLIAKICFETESGGSRSVKFDGYNQYINNNLESWMDYQYTTRKSISTGECIVECKSILKMSDGDNVQVKVKQNSGSSIDVNAINTNLQIIRIWK